MKKNIGICPDSDFSDHQARQHELGIEGGRRATKKGPDLPGPSRKLSDQLVLIRL